LLPSVSLLSFCQFYYSISSTKTYFTYCS
jgi:hypothetical protein